MNDAAPAPFWIFAIALLLVLVFMANFPRAGAALLGVLVLGLILTARRQGFV
jgi:hypothetical protein